MRRALPLAFAALALAAALVAVDRLALSARAAELFERMPELELAQPRTHTAARPGGAVVSAVGHGGLVLERVIAAPRRVFALARRGGELFAATDGGIAVLAGPLPGALASMRVLTMADGLSTTDVHALTFEGGRAGAGRPGPLTPALATRFGTLVGGDDGLSIDGREVELPAAVRALAQDGDGVLVSTDLGNWRVTASGEASLGGPPANALLADGGVLYAGTDDGLAWRDAAGWHRAPFPGPPAPFVTALAVLPHGELAAGTFDAGAALLEGNTWRTLPAAAHVSALLARDDALFIADDEGVTRWQAGRAERVVEGAAEALASGPGGELAAIVDDALVVAMGRVRVRYGEPQGFCARKPGAVAFARGALFAGGLDGLCRFSRGAFARVTAASGALPDDWVTALAADGAALWAGTYDGGLARLDARGARRFTESDGLPAGKVNPRALVAFGGKLAYGAQAGGLVWFDGRAFHRLGPADGLPSDDVTALAVGGGRLYVGTRAGIAVFRLPGGDA